MLTKVSYNAYASSANGMQRPNQPKNVNFGALSREALETLGRITKNLTQTQFFDPASVVHQKRDILNDLQIFLTQASDATGREVYEALNRVLMNT